MAAKPSWRIIAFAARKVRARFIFSNSASGIGAPDSWWRANRSSAARSQHQFSMIWDGSSTKSHATLVPARLRTSTRDSRWCSRCPNSWNSVSTSSCVSRAGLSPTGGVTLPQIRPRCGPMAPSRSTPETRPFIHAPPRFSSRGNRST